MATGSISPLAGPRFHYVTAVWGESFTRRFLDVVLPTHASPGNLGALSDRPGDVFHVYTTDADAETLRRSPMFRSVQAMVDTRVHPIEPWLAWAGDKYGVIGGVHQEVLEAAHEHHAAAVFLSPDAVFADGAFARLREWTLQGIRRVMIAGVRADASGWLRAMGWRKQDATDDIRRPWTVSPREAMRAALSHPHAWTEAARWDAPAMHEAPSQLYFPVDAEHGLRDGAICRAFHLHPLLVWPHDLFGRLSSTVDGDLSRVAPAEPHEVHLVEDSEELAAIELSDSDAVPYEATIPAHGRAAIVAEWGDGHADESQWAYLTRSIRLRGEPVEDDAWRRTEHAAKAAVTAIEHQRLIRQPAESLDGKTDSSVAVPDGATRAQLHFVVPVWGGPYIDRFLKWGLPSFLALDNLPAVADRTFCFEIVTDEADLPRYQQHPAIERLSSLVSLKFTTPQEPTPRYGEPDDSLGYGKMSRYYNHAIAGVDRGDVAHVFLTPEGVFSNGMFPAILNRLDAGYRAVALPGFRVLEEAAIEDLLAHHLSADRVSLSATPRELVRWLLRHPHPISRAHAWDDRGALLHPHYYWHVGDAGLVAHCFHVHPLAVWPERVGHLLPAGQTLDHEYLQESVPLNRVHLVTDSDEMAVIDIARDGHLDNTFSAVPYAAKDVADFASEWTNGYHRSFFERRIRVHAEPVDSAWEPVEAKAMSTVADVMGRLQRSLEMPIYADSRKAQALQAALASQQAARARWVKVALGLERRQQVLRQRVDEVGWLRAFALRSRARRWWARASGQDSV